MKRAHVLPAVLLLLGGACSEEEESLDIAPVGEPASVSVTAAAPAAAHGGTVLMPGDQPIEVVVDEEGALLAYYLDGPPEAPQDVQVTIKVPEASGEVRPVMLTWDPGEARYFGQLRGATPVPGPLEIVIDLGGDRVRASAPTFVLVEPLAAHAPAVDVHVQAPSAPNVVVEAPARPHVVVERPSRPHVVVEAPTPPSIRVRAPAPPSVRVRAPEPPSVRVRAPAPPSVRVRAPEPPSVRVRAPAPPSVRVRAEGPRVRVRAERGNRGRD